MDKTFDAAARERDIYAAWVEAGAFRAGAGRRRDESFCVMIPPPNVTGALHMGHAFNNTLQDILTRWHRMRGYDTLWQPGTDHAGIATQMVVERELAREGNVSRREMGREKFIERVWQQKQRSRGNIRQQLERLGASCDWSREAFTMGGAPGDPEGTPGGQNFHDAVLRTFVEFYERGLIYRGKRLVNWDPHFETAISDLEVEQVETDGHLWRLRYPLEAGQTFEYVETDEEGRETLRETRDYITVATTRPETMLGDTGVAVHPDDARYAHLVGKTVRLPLVGRYIPIVADPHADPKKGTGAVKITPAHDFNDWEVGERTGLPAINIMTPRAEMFLDHNADFLRGADPGCVPRVIEALDGANRYEAREWIVEIAREEGWLDGVDPDRHVVPHGDRSKVAVEPYLTDQWFVDTAKLVQPAIDAVRDGRTTILPESDAKVYFHWLENIEPWCISRQLWWGHQIPVWYLAYPTDQEKFVATMTEDIAHAKFDFAWEELTACAPTFSAAAAELEERIPYSCRIAEDVERVGREEGLGTGASVADDGTILLNARRDPDVLDTWFSSGIWPLGTLGWPEDTPELARYYPTSVLVTGFDIIFFWVARMMMMQLELVKQVPFETVYVHALVRDEKGKKMSKSLGNVLDPLDLVDEFGADAVRFTLTAMAAMGRDLRLSRDRIAGYRNFVTKLWNAHRFAEMNGVLDVQNGADPDSNLQNAGSKLTRTGQTPPTATATANRWIIGETARVREEVDAALAAYRFNDAANALYAFTWGRVCDWYLEFSKPLFDGEKAEETRIVMAWVLDQCLILLHPIMPFVTEELWGLGRHRPALLALTEWPEYGAELVDPASESEMRWIISLIEGVRSVRGEMNVPAGARVPLLRVELSEAGRNALSRNEDLVLRLARLETITATDAVPKGSATIAVEGGTFALPLAEIIDIAAEKSRLSKSLDKLAREAGGLDKRLSNPRFVESAPPEVVDETRDLLAQKQEEQARLQTALARLAEAG